MLGQAQRSLKDFDGAMATVQKLKTSFANDPRGSYLEALVLRDRGQFDQSIQAFELLMNRAGHDGSLVYEYAGVLERAGRLPDAERALRGVLAKDPQDANALNSLGYMLADHGQRLDEAIDLVQQALKSSPRIPRSSTVLAGRISARGDSTWRTNHSAKRLSVCRRVRPSTNISEICD